MRSRRRRAREVPKRIEALPRPLVAPVIGVRFADEIVLEFQNEMQAVRMVSATQKQ